MATIDFSKITVQTVDGGTEAKDYREYIGRQLYNQSHDETGFNLSKKIFGSKGAIKLNDDECNIIRTLIAPMPYFMRSAIENLLNG